MGEPAQNDDRKPWERAIERFRAEGFVAGDIVRKSWLFEAFGINEPDPSMKWAWAKEAQFAFMQCMDNFRRELLERYSVDLTTLPGVGYEVTPPAEQTQRAVKHGLKAARKALRVAASRVEHIDHAALTDAQRRENADAAARLAKLRAGLGKRRGR